MQSSRRLGEFAEPDSSDLQQLSELPRAFGKILPKTEEMVRLVLQPHSAVIFRFWPGSYQPLKSQLRNGAGN